MLPAERQNKILELLANRDLIKIPDLVSEFNISIETVRRDLNILEKENKIVKVYGGIKLADNTAIEPPLENRQLIRLSAKDKLGQKCSEFINDGDCIFIDSGTTTHHISKYIKDKKNIIVITNSIPVVNELMDSNIEIILIGGKIRHSEKSVVAYEYLFNFSGLNITKSFLCAGGVTAEKGLSDFDMSEALTRKKILEISSEVFVVADSSKLGRNVPISICPMEKIDFIITNSPVEESIKNSFENRSCKLHIVDV